MPDHARHEDDDTSSDLRDHPPRRRSRWSRRAGIGVLTVIVALAALDLLGPRAGDTSAENGGFTLTVEYPQIARAGEPAPLHVTVESTTGFAEVVQLRMCDEYVDHLDFQNWYPNPSAETALANWIVYEFDSPPMGTVLEVSLDARVAPGQLGGIEECRISVLVDDEPVVSAAFTTWRTP